MRIENKDEGIPITALREMCILKHLKHENIVALHEIIQDIDKIFLVFEYVDEDLKMHIDRLKGLKDLETVKVKFIIFINKYLSLVFYISNIKWSLFLSFK